MNCNPMYYLRHAWEATHSYWGKACIVLFYSFLWIQILGAAWSLYDAETGWDCLYDTVADNDSNMIVATFKVVNFWILGFMLYADRGGIKVWNVFMVALFYVVQWLLYKPAITEFLADACPDDLRTMNISMIVTQIWIFLALGSSFMESLSGEYQEI